ncbi:hypothetical protein [Geodermatophilus sp. URMC 62]|uniref:hypothetical protein n=1 Tax=Geodermatophilus sp. URMC 62 TaxID=3423414 RepID=UPI00406C1F8D
MHKQTLIGPLLAFLNGDPFVEGARPVRWVDLAQQRRQVRRGLVELARQMPASGGECVDNRPVDVAGGPAGLSEAVQRGCQPGHRDV